MVDKTLSEKLFEQFCEENSITLREIVREPHLQRKTPDYDILLDNRLIIVEVKQLDPNPDDKHHLHRLKVYGSTGVMESKPGHRVRGKISDAMPQLKSRSKGKYPAILVLYNNVGILGNYIEPYDIRTGMYGLEMVDIAVPENPQTEPILFGHRFGGKRKVSPTHNTTLSAIASLYKNSNTNLQLDLYHSEFAANPIDPDWLRISTVKHYELDTKISKGGLREWREI